MTNIVDNLEEQMGDWLLVIAVMSGFWGSGFPVTEVTMHDFPSKALCESAAKHAEEMAVYETTFSYRCLEKAGGEWIEGK